MPWRATTSLGPWPKVSAGSVPLASGEGPFGGFTPGRVARPGEDGPPPRGP